MGGFSSGGGNPLMQAGAMAIDTYTGIPVASTALTLAQAKAQTQAGQDAAQQASDRQAEMLRRQQDRQIQERQDLLRRTTASQRARMGAMGAGSDSGSAEALINGLQRQAATELGDIRSAYGDRLSTLDWSRQGQQDQLEQAWTQQWLSSVMPTTSSVLPGKKKQSKGGSSPAPEGGFNLL